MQSNKFVISLQYLKKEVRDGVYFLHSHKHQSFGNSVLSFLMEVTRHVRSTQNRKMAIFLEYLKRKKCHTAFLFNFDVKHSDILPGSSHVRCYLLSTHCTHKLN